MENLPQYVLIIGEVFGLVGLLAALWLYFRSQTQRTTVEQLSTLVDTLMKKVEIMEEEKAQMATRLLHIEQENAVLRSIVTGEAKINELVVLQNEQHREVMHAIDGLSKNHRSLVRVVENLESKIAA